MYTSQSQGPTQDSATRQADTPAANPRQTQNDTGVNDQQGLGLAPLAADASQMAQQSTVAPTARSSGAKALQLAAMQNTLNKSPKALQLKAMRETLNKGTAAKPAATLDKTEGQAQPHQGGGNLGLAQKKTATSGGANPQAQPQDNNTGLPGPLKAGIEQLSGYAMDDVRVHYDSGKPAQLNAHAYVQGTDIHVGPGQAKHLPHEAWHVVQQKQGRVRPTQTAKGLAINDQPALEHEADAMGAKATQQQATMPTKGVPSHTVAQPKSMAWQLMFVAFDIVHENQRTEITSLADMLVWLRSHPIDAKDTPRSFAEQKILMRLCNNIVAEEGRHAKGHRVWEILARLTKEDDEHDLDIMPYYRMMDPVKVKLHFNMLKHEHRNIKSEVGDIDELPADTLQFYLEEGEKLEGFKSACTSFAALVSFLRKRRQVVYHNKSRDILKTEIVYLKHYNIAMDFEGLALTENTMAIIEAKERDYNQAKEDMQDFLRFRADLQIKNGEGVDGDNWTTYRMAGLEENEETVPKHFKRRLSHKLMKKQMAAMQQRLAGHEFVGFHGTSVENITTLVKEGVDTSRFGSGHGSGKGEGLYIIPLASSLGKTIESAMFWGHSHVAVFVPNGCKMVPAWEGDNVQTLEGLRGQHANAEQLIYGFGQDEAVIPPSLCGAVILVADPSSVSMVNTADLPTGGGEYEAYTSAEEEFSYLERFKPRLLPTFSRGDLDPDEESAFSFE